VRLFDRVFSLTLFARAPLADGDYFRKVGDAIKIEQIVESDPALRIQFSVKKDLAATPNRGQITISQLAPSTRMAIERARLGVQLAAGHDGAPRLLFSGDVRRATSERVDNTEIETKLELGDGLVAYSTARMDRAYKRGVPMRKVLEDAAASLGLDLPPELAADRVLDQPLTTGLTAQGTTRDILDRVLGRFGYGWSMQNERLQIMRVDQVREGDIFLISSGAKGAADTGMIGVPQRTTPDSFGSSKSGKAQKPESSKSHPEIKAETLLWPDLEPGARARVVSELWSADVKLTDVEHEGDTWGDKWSTSVTGRPIS
jgi:hypothetical protein